MLRLSLIILLSIVFKYAIATADTAIANVALDAATHVIEKLKIKIAVKAHEKFM